MYSSMMRRLNLRIFNWQQFPFLLNFNSHRQFGHSQCLVKLPAKNGNAINLQHLLQKQMASTFSLTSETAEKLEYTQGKSKRILKIECIDGKNNAKYICLSRQVCCTFINLLINFFPNFYLDFDKFDFPKISLPEDCYSLVKAMDKMMSKFPDEEKPPIFHEFVKSCIPNHEYKLEIHPTKNGQLQFVIEKFKNMQNSSSHRLGLIFFPVSLLPEFRDRLAKIMRKIDGNEQFGPCPSLSPKWIAAEQEKDKQQQQQFKSIRRESLKYSIDPAKSEKTIFIELKRGVLGRKYIRIELKVYKPAVGVKNVQEDFGALYIHFPNILVPEDGYNLLSGMIDLSNDLKLEEGKLSIQRNKHQQSSLICRQIVKGNLYDYKLEIHLRENQELEFRMETITTSALASHKPKKLSVPIDVFDWLQEQMALSLAADLDTEEYKDKEENEEDKSPLPIKPKPVEINKN